MGETYALSYFTNDEGIMELKIDYLKSISNPIFTYEGSTKAKKHLQNTVEKNKLCLKYSSLEKGKNSCFYYQIKKCKGVCCGEESITEYNKRVLKYIVSVQSIKVGNSIFTQGMRKSLDLYLSKMDITKVMGTLQNQQIKMIYLL